MQIGLGLSGTDKLIRPIHYPAASGYVSAVSPTILGRQLPREPVTDETASL